jgi:hypothetical protein
LTRLFQKVQFAHDAEDGNESVAMGDNIHHLVLLHGREAASRMVEPERRPLVDIAAEVLADESRSIGISYTGFCLTSLPHKRLADDAPWEKHGHRVTLLVEPGRMKVNGQTKLWGVPFGARARMILLYLQTAAVRTGSREVELGRSMRDWMGRMGIAWGGETAKAMREQATRISACSLKFFWEEERGSSAWSAGRIVNSGLQLHDMSSGDDQGKLWEDRVVLDQTFFDALRDHPVPLLETAIRQLRDRSLSLDIYVWLAWRLHNLERQTPIRWAAVHQQFGAGFKEVRHFRPRFVQALDAALAAYPDARVMVDERGLILHPSRPPIAPRVSGSLS